MAVECEHEWVPGEYLKDRKFWELDMRRVRCSKCGFIDPDLYCASPETTIRRREREKYESDDAYKKHRIETGRRYERLGIADIAI